MHRPVTIASWIATVSIVASGLVAAGGCEQKKKSSEEAPVRPGTSPDQQRPKPPAPPPPADPHAGHDMGGTPPAPAGSVGSAPGSGLVTPPAGAAMDTVRPPVAADLAEYLKAVKGKGTLTATIETNMGTFHCTLFEKETPMTVANFVGLATGQKPWTDPKSGQVQKGKPYFDGLGFHRVIPDFMIQGGDPLGQGVGGPGYEFDNEIVPSLRHDGAGVLSMANAGPGTNGSQFFVTEKATPWLDGRHTVFGKCKEGELVKKMTALAGPGDRPSSPITMTKVTISRS